MEKYKKITIRESYPDENSPGEIVSTRILTAPTYQELFKTIDKEDHGLLIYQVKSYNEGYIGGCYGVALSIYLVAQAALITYLKNNMDADDFSSNLLRKIVETVLYLATSLVIVTAIYSVVDGIIDMIKNKEIATEGSKFVETNYPDEYESIKPVKSKKKIFKLKKKEEDIW